jgi:hypothetical protein
MNLSLFLFLLAAAVFCADVSEIDMRGHVAAKNIAFIQFFSNQVNDPDFPPNANVICQAIHIPRTKEYSVDDLHFNCFSTLELDGFYVEVGNITCTMDESDSEFFKITTPIRDGSCRLTPVIKPLPANYRQELEAFKKQQMWFCEKQDCADIHITFYNIISHRVNDFFQNTNSNANVKCGSQICFFDKHSSFEFYKKLFLLFWNK